MRGDFLFKFRNCFLRKSHSFSSSSSLFCWLAVRGPRTERERERCSLAALSQTSFFLFFSGKRKSWREWNSLFLCTFWHFLRALLTSWIKIVLVMKCVWHAGKKNSPLEVARSEEEKLPLGRASLERKQKFCFKGRMCKLAPFYHSLKVATTKLTFDSFIYFNATLKSFWNICLFTI